MRGALLRTWRYWAGGLGIIFASLDCLGDQPYSGFREYVEPSLSRPQTAFVLVSLRYSAQSLQ